MDSVQATAPTLLPIAADLANLTVGISMHHITVRLMRMWEARNFKKSDELMSLEQLRFKQCASPSHGLVAVGEKFLAASQLRNTSASSGSIFFWSWTKPQVEVKSFPVESINSIVANSEGTYLVGGGISGDIYIYLWEVAIGKLLKKWHGHYRSVTCLVLSRDDIYDLLTTNDLLYYKHIHVERSTQTNRNLY